MTPAKVKHAIFITANLSFIDFTIRFQLSLGLIGESFNFILYKQLNFWSITFE